MPDAYFDAAYAATYDDNHPGLEGDLAYYAALAREAAAKGQEVLELGAGNGRVTIPIAREGVRITGLERSPPMLQIARERSAGIETVTWVEGDMAGFDLGRRFGLAIIPYRSFLHLTTSELQGACLACVREHLLPGGRLALNFFSPDLSMLAQRMRSGEDGAPRRTRRQAPPGGRDGLTMRYVSREEFEAMLAGAGFAVEALYGWFDGTAYGPSSTEMVWLARLV